MAKTTEPRKPRTIKKCDYLVEEIVKNEGKENAIATVTSTVFNDAGESERYIKAHLEAFAGKTLRIVRVCKVVTVKPVDSPKFKLEAVR